MIVVGNELDARRQRLLELRHSGIHFVGYYHGIAIGLTVDREQYRWLAVCGHHRVLGLCAVANRGDIADVNPGRVCLHNDLAEFLGAANLAVDQPQDELVIVLDQAGRIDKVRLRDCVRDVRYRDGGAQELGGVRRD